MHSAQCTVTCAERHRPVAVLKRGLDIRRVHKRVSVCVRGALAQNLLSWGPAGPAPRRRWKLANRRPLRHGELGCPWRSHLRFLSSLRRRALADKIEWPAAARPRLSVRWKPDRAQEQQEEVQVLAVARAPDPLSAATHTMHCGEWSICTLAVGEGIGGVGVPAPTGGPYRTPRSGFRRGRGTPKDVPRLARAA